MSPPARAAHHAPPLPFVIFWNAFTAVHATFMLQGAWGTGAMFFVVPFYFLFFGVGFWMARAWWQGRRLRQQFGRPALEALPPVVPGHSLMLTVAFDRRWTPGAALTGQLRWVSVTAKGHSGDTLAETALSGHAVDGPQGTQWQASATVPPQPESATRIRLELVLQPPGTPSGNGWRFVLPLQAPADLAQSLSAEQARQIDKVLGWGVMLLAAVGSWQLYSWIEHGSRALFPFGFAGGFFVAAWVLQDFRGALLAAVGPGSAGREQLAEKLGPFAARAKTRLSFFFALLVLAFFVDAFGLLNPGALPGR
jgi:hypothetical protein